MGFVEVVIELPSNKTIATLDEMIKDEVVITPFTRIRFVLSTYFHNAIQIEKKSKCFVTVAEPRPR